MYVYFSDEKFYTVEDAVEKLGFGPFQILVTVFAGLIWLADAMELMLLSVLSPNVKCLWDLSDSEEASITSVVFVGFFFGAFVWGAVCDVIGRKMGLLVVNVFVLVFGVLSAIPITSDPSAKYPAYPWLLLCRAGVGFGAGGTGQAVTYYAEFLPKRFRGVCITLQEMWWALGSILGAGLAVAVMVPGGLGWHWYLGLSTIPLFIAVSLFVFIPESARFYIVKGKYAKAEKVIKLIARYNCKQPLQGVLVSFEEKERREGCHNSEPVLVRYSEGDVVIGETSETLQQNEEDHPLLDDHDQSDSETTEIKDNVAVNFSTKRRVQLVTASLCTSVKSFLLKNLTLMFLNEMWKTTVLLFFLWFGAAWLYYGIVLLTTQFLQHDPHCGYVLNESNMTCEVLTRDDYISILWTGVAEVPGIVVTMVLVELIGRKLTMVAEFLLTMVGFLLLFVCGERILLTIFLFIIRAFATGVFQAIFVYTPEVYPTTVRAFALGTCSAAARIGAIITPYTAQVLVEHSDLATISLYAGSCLVLAILSCLLPIETKGRSLTDGGAGKNEVGKR
ncbi:synaptic vesicle 2-related protein-like isoform X2 [Halichondria panicea]|uniref:synaptic vesicle 2-related protein-like isoform X2 n=1 Tax=Halichondria panicea TaxID=6063 RepID=UPI00312B9538